MKKRTLPQDVPTPSGRATPLMDVAFAGTVAASRTCSQASMSSPPSVPPQATYSVRASGHVPKVRSTTGVPLVWSV